MEQEVRGESHFCDLLGSLWPARALQMKGACCSMLDAMKTFESFYFFWEKISEKYECACERCLGHCAWQGEAHLHPYAGRGASATGPLVQGVFHTSEYSAFFSQKLKHLW